MGSQAAAAGGSDLGQSGVWAGRGRRACGVRARRGRTAWPYKCSRTATVGRKIRLGMSFQPFLIAAAGWFAQFGREWSPAAPLQQLRAGPPVLDPAYLRFWQRLKAIELKRGACGAALTLFT
jgi:hypothetical protein